MSKPFKMVVFSADSHLLTAGFDSKPEMEAYKAGLLTGSTVNGGCKLQAWTVFDIGAQGGLDESKEDHKLIIEALRKS